jgi:hypothetical protein
MSLLDRLRGWLRPDPDPDHPLSEEEREGVPQTAPDEESSLIEGFVDPGVDE